MPRVCRTYGTPIPGQRWKKGEGKMLCPGHNAPQKGERKMLCSGYVALMAHLYGVKGARTHLTVAHGNLIGIVYSII